jgi:hypothetical protein
MRERRIEAGELTQSLAVPQLLAMRQHVGDIGLSLLGSQI